MNENIKEENFRKFVKNEVRKYFETHEEELLILQDMIADDDISQLKTYIYNL
jgi:hypothetical protein